MAEAARIPQPSAPAWRAPLAGARRLAVLALGLALAACSTVVPRTQGPAPTQQGPARPAPTAAPRIDSTIPQDTQRHSIALLVPMTGANAAVGQSIANATQLAILDTKTDRIRVTTYDTTPGAAAAAQRALADGNRLILGPLLADDVRVIAPLARAARVPVITFSNDASVAGGGTYVLGYTPAQSITRVVSFAASRGIREFAGLIPNGLYGDRAATAFLRAVEAAGGQVLALQTYDRQPGALGAAVQRLAKSGPYRAVLIADSGGTGAVAVPLIRRSGGATAQIMGTDLWNTETSLASNPALNGAWYASVSNALYRQYAIKYRARFGTAPFRLSSLGYDAVLLTVRIVRDWPIGTPFPVARLADRGGFAGLDGAFRFGADGVAERALEVQEFRAGTTATISPAPAGF
ncbi:penicillin-binding protein activator [Sphingomonas sp.]|uniref:penicillin-binding protein activator n=1 Tax=Sphingomonas sp. TaxID=28214 RepID=UPI001D620475|nr:penicillin-binding protein activator [Sphingomonas sp.]MBX9797547.1 penicillin-binding protein activator [Sphingomonas sp.]